MAGAVLTQNTAWTNVERALANLRAAGVLTPEGILALPAPRLAALLRPAGCFNVKARRLRALCRWLQAGGGIGRLRRAGTAGVRRRLLAVHGIGPETADAICLYALGRPVFVIDAYARRLFGRLGLVRADVGYEILRARIETALGPDAALYNEYHALLVTHGKKVCRPRPLCAECVLAARCPARRI